MQRGAEYTIMLGGNELMSSRLSGSEEALGRWTCERLRNGSGAKLLIGGLGMGFTLRAVLAALRADAEVVVAELVPGVVAWARGPLATVFGACLEDPRVRIFEGDVFDLIGLGRSRFDAILLDVDNGPDGLTSGANQRLYGEAGLLRARDALQPGGILSIWSSAPDKAFTERLRRAEFAVEELSVRAVSNGRGAHHVIWLATKGFGERFTHQVTKEFPLERSLPPRKR